MHLMTGKLERRHMCNFMHGSPQRSVLLCGRESIPYKGHGSLTKGRGLFLRGGKPTLTRGRVAFGRGKVIFERERVIFVRGGAIQQMRVLLLLIINFFRKNIPKHQARFKWSLNHNLHSGLKSGDLRLGPNFYPKK